MADITMCKGTACNLKHFCRRYNPNPERWQSMFVLIPIDKMTGECPAYITKANEPDAIHKRRVQG